MIAPPPQRDGRETRLLLATIAIAVVMLLLLARLRFPAQPIDVAEPAPAPLERLAAQASYEDLAGAIAELNRRVAPSLVSVRVQPERTTGSYAVAIRVTVDRAVVLLEPFESLRATAAAAAPAILFRHSSGIAVIALEPSADRVATARTGTPRRGPRYVAVADATAAGTSLRPVFVSSTDVVQDPLSRAAVLAIVAPPQQVARGAAVFTLAGLFAGIVTGSHDALRVLPAEALKGIAEGGPPAKQAEADLGVDVQPLTEALARMAGASSGVMIADVDPRGPSASALRPGDVVQSIDGAPLATVEEFVAAERSRTPGAAIPLTIVRRGQPADVQIVAREAQAPPPAAQGHGLTLRRAAGGTVAVTAVAAGSAGEEAGLARGDVITSIDGRRPVAAADLDRAFAATAPGAGMLLTIERATGRRVVALEKR